MARAKTKTPSPAAIALRGAAAELERQAAALRAKADLLDGGAASTVKAISKAKPKKAAKAKPAKKAAAKKGAKRKAAKKAKPRQTDLERDFLPKGARGRAKPMPAGALKKLTGAHKNGAAHPAIRQR